MTLETNSEFINLNDEKIKINQEDIEIPSNTRIKINCLYLKNLDRNDDK